MYTTVQQNNQIALEPNVNEHRKRTFTTVQEWTHMHQITQLSSPLSIQSRLHSIPRVVDVPVRLVTVMFPTATM